MENPTQQEHNYTTATGAGYVPWHEWVRLNCTTDEHTAFLDPSIDSEQKQELYERWLQDQGIISYTRIVDGEIVQYQEWDWS